MGPNLTSQGPGQAARAALGTELEERMVGRQVNW